MLHDVSPRLMLADTFNGLWVDAEAPSECGLLDASSRLVTDLHHYLGRELGHAVAFASRLAFWVRVCAASVSRASSWASAPFVRHVFVVVGRCSEKQMIGVAARSVIAVVAHVQIFGRFSVSEFPSEPMSLNWRAARNRKGSIPVSISGSCPFPTAGCERWMQCSVLVNLWPKTFGWCFRSGCGGAGSRAIASRSNWSRLTAAFTGPAESHSWSTHSWRLSETRGNGNGS